jgi:hypothetical protein
MLTDLLFDVPWWLPTAAIGIGAVVFLSGNRRQEKNVMRGGQVLILLGVLIAIVSWMVDTDLEKAIKRTRQLAAAVDIRDWQAFASLLDERTNFADYHNREQLVEGARKTADFIGLKSVVLTSVRAEQLDTLITVDIDALSVQEKTMDRPVPTSWRLHWQDMGKGWLLYNVEVLPNRAVGPQEITRELVR